jgi:Peptidase family M28
VIWQCQDIIRNLAEEFERQAFDLLNMNLPKLMKAQLTLLLALGLGVPARAADHPPSLEHVLKSIQSEIKPDQAMDFMRHVYSTDRWFTFPKFEETAEYLKRTMEEIGLKNVEVLGAPADGVSQVGYWTMPLAWDAKSAKLEILDSDLSPQQRILADYQKIPSSLGMWSGPTPPEGITAEVVAVNGDDATAIAKMPLKGKLVLTDHNPANFKWALVKAGALGAINAFTENPELKDGRQWVNAWGDNGWAFTKASTPLLSFSISPNQAALVRKLLAERGTVRVKATVDTRYYSGKYPYVTAVIPGTGPEEVLTLGHSSEQGAEDNATGVAAILESLATLRRLIAEGKLPQPRRSIRIMVMGEMYGSMHYVSTHPDQVRRTVAAMCVDTPAASYSLAGTEYTFYMNPHAAKSYTDAFILKVAEEYFPTVGRPWHSHAFMTGTDTYLAEPAVNIPIVWPYSGSGVETHHNSEDTPDRVDPRSLRDVSVVNAAYLYYLASAGEPEAAWLAELSETRGYEQILKTAAPFLDRIEAAQDTDGLRRLQADAPDYIAYSVDRESQSVLSVLRLAPEDKREELKKALAPSVEKLRQFGNEQSERIRSAVEHKALELGINVPIKSIKTPEPQAAEASKIVVRRKRFGTIPLDDLPHGQWEGYPSGAWAAIPTAALYWCDGHRNLAEVIHLTEMELGPTQFDFVGYFRFLRARGYVDFVGK